MIRLFSRYWLVSAAVSFVVEMALLVAAVSLAVRLRSWVFFGVADSRWTLYSPVDFWIRAGLFTVAMLVWLYIIGLYDFEHRYTTRQVSIKLLQATTFAALSLGGIYFAFPAIAMGRGVFALAFPLALAFLLAWRPFMSRFVTNRLLTERILIIGTDSAAKSLAKEILARSHLGYRVVGFLSDSPDLQGVSLINPRVIGTTAQACELALANNASRVVVAQQDHRGKVSLDSLLDCKTRGIPVSRSSTYFEELTGRLLLNGPRIKSWLIFSSGFVVSRSVRLTKRTFDFLMSAVGLVLAAPIALPTMIAIRLESPGPAIFRQERVGLRGRRMTLWKFRTMVVDAEASGEAQWAEEDDPRITRVGRFLRKSRLDELPQLWNILKGDMSLVGPRPERREFVDKLVKMCPLYEERLVVRPGLTGWAQIKAPYAASFEESLEKLEYDLYYIKNLSFFLDLSILASTFRIVLFGRGAR